VLPAGAGVWGLVHVQGESESRLADARLEAGLRAALGAYQGRLDAAAASAAVLARSPSVGHALARTDRRALVRLARARGASFIDHAGRRLGPRPAHAAVSRVVVVGRGGTLGTVEAFVRLDRRLVQSLRRAAGLPVTDELAFVDRRRVIGATGEVHGTFTPPATRSSVVRVAAGEYRALGAPLAGTRSVQLAVLTSERGVVARTVAAQRHLFAAFFVALVLIASVAYLEGSAILRTIRALVAATHEIARGRLGHRVVPRGADELAALGRSFNAMADQLQQRLDELEAERTRLREIVSRFGAALAATHDVEELMRVVVETIVRATQARCGTFVGPEGSVLVGDPAATGRTLEVELRTAAGGGGTLMLVGDALEPEADAIAHSLAAHAVLALENAQLHRLVAQQAATDGLTGLPNRRQLDVALAAEVGRVHRYGGYVSVAFADLDGFKRLNDDYGHATGDLVLREFAEVVRSTLRQADVGGRWGGEEFMLLLPETDVDGAINLADRVRRTLEARTILAADGTPLEVTASFGVATLHAGDAEVDLIAAADAALYEAKRQGKNCVVSARAATAA
jgi:diguanylate cyclase (GGDEF)-like protein